MCVDDKTENGIRLSKEILKHNCDLNYQNKNGYTPLALCVLYDNQQVAKMLVDNGADMFLNQPE
jgi:ankyrin repeat protein